MNRSVPIISEPFQIKDHPGLQEAFQRAMGEDVDIMLIEKAVGIASDKRYKNSII